MVNSKQELAPVISRVYFHPYGQIGHVLVEKKVVCGRKGHFAFSGGLTFGKTDCRRCIAGLKKRGIEISNV